MNKSVAIIGAGVSGLTSGVVLAERGFRVSIFAREIGQQTTSAAAAALWYPYDAEPMDKVIPWALDTYKTLVDLSHASATGVSMIELRQFSRTGQIQIPDWAIPLGAQRLASSVIPSGVEESRCAGFKVATRDPSTSLRYAQNDYVFYEVEESSAFTSGLSMIVPLMDTTIYLDYLANRFLAAGGSITENLCFEKLEDVSREFHLVINCAGFGARELVDDVDLEPHRGQVAIVPKIAGLSCAVVCDDTPLMYAIPRGSDCVFGGTNELSDNLEINPESASRILDECSRVLKIEKPAVLAERVGLRPYRKSGVRLERNQLRDGRLVIHNYGHGGSGFTLSWGCAQEVRDLASQSISEGAT